MGVRAISKEGEIQVTASGTKQIVTRTINRWSRIFIAIYLREAQNQQRALSVVVLGGCM